MPTEITDTAKVKGWVLYDADCRSCVRWAARLQAPLARRRFELVPLQTPWVRERLGLPKAELLAEMRLLQLDCKVVGGADALLEISRHFWWAWPLRQLARLPAALKLFRAGYRWVARHRHCAAGACAIGARPSRAQQRQNHRAPGVRRKPPLVNLFDYIPLLVLPPLALLGQSRVAPWVFMWAMAFALYAGCKWLTYRVTVRTLGLGPGTAGNSFRHSAFLQLPDFADSGVGFRAKYGYLLAWPGMNAAEFFDRKIQPAKPRKIEWALAVTKTIFGAMLLWGIARLALPAHPLVAGWIGMIGAIFVLHFGLFHLLSLAWRQAGTNAAPIMQNPLRANSLANFWGTRWNTAFNELAFRFTFRPLRRWTTPTAAMLGVFGLSGLIHELVISLPAQGGYGLPTLYFVTQGLGVVIERSRPGRSLGLGHGIRGWLFALLTTAGPVTILFHPPFIHHVILPMLTAIGAT